MQSKFEQIVLRWWGNPAWLAPLVIFGCVASACTYVLINNPADNAPDPLGPCAFKALTGYDCPGCGGTRMVWYLLHGNVVQAARHHLVVFLAIPFVLYAYAVMVAGRIFHVTLPRLRISAWPVATFCAVWALYAVLRNLPWAPFHTFFV